MTALRLIPRATKIEGGRWRPEVVVQHQAGDMSIWGTQSVETQAEARRLAKRLATIAAEMTLAPNGSRGPAADAEDTP